MERPVPVRFRFAEFEADVTTGELYRSGTPVPLQSKPFAFLASLLKKPGEVITREDLSRILWPDTHVQTNQGLNAAIRKVRLALSDKALSPRFIETLGSRGYRFIYPVEATRWSNGMAGLLQASVGRPRIAVLPLETSSDSGVFLPRALTHGFVVHLAKWVPSAVFVSVSSADTSNLTGTAVGKVRMHRNVHYFLARKACVTGGHLKVTVTLSHAAERRHLWSETFEGDADMFGQFEQATAGRIAESIRPRVVGSRSEPSFPRPVRAHEEYLLGCHFLNQRTPSAIRKGLLHLERAVQEDPKFARAYAGLADGYNILGTHGMMVPREAFAKAKWAANTALMIVPDLSEALVALSWAKTILDYDIAAGRQTAEQALFLNPGYAYAYNVASYLAIADGSHEEAIELMRQGRDLDPVSPTSNTHLSYILALCQHFEEALQQARFTLELDPRYPFGYSCAGIAYIGLGRYPEAVDSCRAALEHAPGSQMLMATLAHALAVNDQREDALKLLMELINHDEEQPKPSYHIGVAYAALGDVERAMEWLVRSLQERSNWLLFVKADLRLAHMRKHPQMSSLLAELPSRTGT